MNDDENCNDVKIYDDHHCSGHTFLVCSLSLCFRSKSLSHDYLHSLGQKNIFVFQVSGWKKKKNKYGRSE